MKDLIIVGAGGLGRELLQVIKDINAQSPEWNVLGFIDDNGNALNGIACDRGLIGTIRDWQPKGSELYAMGIAKTETKRMIAEKLTARGAKFANIYHPTARIADHTDMGEGIVLFPYVDISVNCRIGSFAFVNLFAQVGHDSVIGDYCTLFPNCAVSGGGVLGEGVTMGTGSSTYPGIRIGKYATVGMNSAVIRNVRENSTVMGVPAKKIL